MVVERTRHHPVVGAKIKQAHRRGVPLIVIDPRRTELARLADMHLQLRPGSNVALLNAMGRLVKEEYGQASSRPEPRVWRTGLPVSDCTPEAAEAITGVPAHFIYKRLGIGQTAAAFASMVSRDGTSLGQSAVIALCNLAPAPHIGKPGTGINPCVDKTMHRASTWAALPTYFAGYQFDDPGWHRCIRPSPAAAHEARYENARHVGRGDCGSAQGLWIIGWDVAQTDQFESARCLKHVEFLVVQDLFLSETAKFAHLVLPGASFLEKDGTFTNLERRIQRIRKAVEPPHGILPDWRVVCEVSNRMGYPMPYQHPSEIMDEIAKLTPMCAGVSYDRLDQHAGLQWPVPTATHEGTALMHQETFPKGKAHFVAVDYLPPGEAPTAEYPFVLTTGRILQHYNCGAQTRRTEILELVDTDVLEMHPVDMAALHLRDGEIVRLVSARGDALLPVVESERVLPGYLFTSFHFPSSTVNELLSSSADESSKCPEYKVSAVRVEPIERDDLDPADEAELRHMRRELNL
jgi:predicted molibdopterin-dependent oxidoreductase YjgC